MELVQKAQVGNKWSNILPKILASEEKAIIILIVIIITDLMDSQHLSRMYAVFLF